MEADPRHAELVIRELGLERSNSCKVPGIKVPVNKMSRDCAETEEPDGEGGHMGDAAEKENMEMNEVSYIGDTKDQKANDLNGEENADSADIL